MEPCDYVRQYLNHEITASKLLQVVTTPQDLVGLFANVADEERNKYRKVVDQLCDIAFSSVPYSAVDLRKRALHTLKQIGEVIKVNEKVSSGTGD